jgi:FlaA1/EpsC-like NDP-sugar epimerase
MHSLSAGTVTRSASVLSENESESATESFCRRITGRHRAMLVLGAELVLAAISYVAAALVFTASHVSWTLELLRATLAWSVLFRLPFLASTGLFKRSLRYPTELDLISLTKAVAASELSLGIFLLWRFPMLKIPVGLFAVDAAFLELLWCGLHFGARVQRAQHLVATRRGRRALVIGAGDAGIGLLREIAVDPASPLEPVALLDDDRSKWGRTICGLPVRGGAGSIAAVAAETKAEELLVCIPSATRAQMRTILDACRASSLPVRTLPPLAALLRHASSADPANLTVSRRDLRAPQMDDLLQREEVRVDAEETRQLIHDQVVLVTGAGGSIGSELCRQLSAAGPRRLLLLDKSENGLFFAHREACELMHRDAVRPFLADVSDRQRIRKIFREERPGIVFHAAAHKHVAMLELHPREAMHNNVLGTRNTAEAAVEFGAMQFVNISTDKAVYPTNFMGLSKKLTELCVQELSRQGATRFSNVRFGNVAGSSGSVLRLFQECIDRGQPLRVTDPRATRFFMSVREAVHLILRAAAIGRGGETFVLEMG